MRPARFLPLLLLAACATGALPRPGGRVPVFGVDEPAASGERRILLERPAANDAWLGESGNGRNSMGHLAGRKDFERMFKTYIGASDDRRMIIYPPSVAGGRVFVVDGGLVVSALDAKTGKILWRNGDFKSEGGTSFGAVNADSGRVFALFSNGSVAAFDGDSGAVLWSVDLGVGLKSSIAVCGGMLVFKSGGGELFALDAGSGEKRLSIRTLPDHFGFFKDSAPACAPGGVVAGFSGGDLHFVPLEPGLSGWAAHVSRPDIGGISAIGGIVANPVVSGSMAFVKGYSGPMAALDLKKGDVVWSARSGGSATPALSGGTLFDIDSDGVMRAVEAKSGMALWSVVIGADGARLFSPLLVNNRLLVARSDGVLMKYDPYTGAYAGEQKLAPEIDAAPIAADAALFVISGGNLMAFR